MNKHIASAYAEDQARRAKIALERARRERERRILEALFDRGDVSDDREF